MNASNAVRLTEKQYKRLFTKYYKKFLRQINFEIKTAIHRGEYYAWIEVKQPKINETILIDIRKFIKNYLTAHGYYVREYTLGVTYDQVYPNKYHVSWGNVAVEFKNADKKHREINQSNNSNHKEFYEND